MNESTAVLEPTTEPTDPPGSEEAPSVEVRRTPLVSGFLGVAASAVAVAYLTRALGAAGTAADWGVCAVLAAIGVGYLVSFVDARVPLLVADERGARIRLGRSWCGMTWEQLDEVEHTPRRLWSDGRLVLLPLDEDEALGRLSPAGRRQARLNRRLHGAPFAVPLALTTRVSGTDDLTAALLELVDDAAVVVEVDRSLPDHLMDVDADTDSDPDADTASHGLVVSDLDDTDDTETAEPDDAVAAYEADPVPPTASPTPSPLRGVFRAVRSDVSKHGRHRDPVAEATQGATALRLDLGDDAATATTLPEVDELRRGDPGLEETVAWSHPDLGPTTPSPAVVEDLDPLTPRPAPDPVVGPVLAGARNRIGLGVEQLAERTRIRPHVIEAIEVDDFGPCGGDFYARGHLRTLARVVGVDAAPLVADYDARYADAPIDPRRVFEAELATAAGGPIRGTRGGPNWSVLVAAAMAVILIWSIARLVVDGSTAITPADPGIPPGSGVGALNNPYGAAAAPVPVVLSAPAGGARLIVRDGAGRVVMNDQLAFGATRTLQVSPPVRIGSSDCSVEATVAGQAMGAMGETGQPCQKLYTAPTS